nr:hypothetical protein [Tanacetum cinerariifolium]
MLKVFTMKMEILLEPTSNKLMVGIGRCVLSIQKVLWTKLGGLLKGIHGPFSGRYFGLVRRFTIGYLWPGLGGNHREFGGKPKTSFEEPPVPELKYLSPHLEYAFIESESKLPVIISSDLTGNEKETIIEVLKANKEECIQAFNLLKEKLVKAPIMVALNWNLPFELTCDASDYVVGAVLGQRKEKKFQPRLGKGTVLEIVLLCCVPDMAYGPHSIWRILEKSASVVEIDLTWSLRFISIEMGWLPNPLSCKTLLIFSICISKNSTISWMATLASAAALEGEFDSMRLGVSKSLLFERIFVPVFPKKTDTLYSINMNTPYVSFEGKYNVLSLQNTSYYLEERIRCLDCSIQYDVLGRRFDTLYPTVGYAVLVRIFIEYAPKKKAYRIYNRRTQKINETIHVDFNELTIIAFEQSSLEPALHEMTHATPNSGLVPNPPPSAMFVPPSRKEWYLVFQPVFDEFYSPPASVASLVSVVEAPAPVESTSSPSSTSVDQDAPSLSTS